ncbi:MAG: cryptochrome/photolyase family protein [Acidimicrobiia bacterium]|nr:cryptochrome/photolyase family protein [Acidimicrobiia bacterium]
MGDRSSTILVFGDQLNRRIGALADANPDDNRVLLIESDQLLTAGRHRQRNHLVVTAMRRFGDELTDAGFEVDRRRAATMRVGIEEHRAEFKPDGMIATEPNSRGGRALCRQLDIGLEPSNQFLCHHDDFADWADGRSTMKLEDFYRWNRARLGYLMDGEGDGAEPVEGRWNFDHDNREPPPDDPSMFASPPTSRLDDVDDEVLASLPDGPNNHGAEPVGIWPTSRRAALARLNHFLDRNLENFGRYEDAMTSESWHLAHSLLSPALNIGLLMPDEVCDAVEERYRAGQVPINSAEGIIRQIIGWREYVWGLYWLWPDHIDSNTLNHRRELPPMFTGAASTEMACLADTFAGLDERAWVHHIPRLMLLSNMANLYGIHPRRVMEWMSDRYIDAAEWVMVPNVMGMALWADGGRMATKPYVSGGAYINRMSDYCSSCRYNPRKRTGDDACPFTTLYWDFMARHRDRLADNNRMARPLANLDRLSDLDDVRAQAERTIRAIRDGRA